MAKSSPIMRRVVDSAWFLPALGLAVGGLAVVGLTLHAVPSPLRWLSSAVVALAIAAPVLPVLALVPWHFLAVRGGLSPRRRGPCTVAVADGALSVHRGAAHTHWQLNQISRARRARNDNWTESRMLEDAIGLFSAQGRELVRVPLAATGIDELIRALDERGVPVEDVLVSAPAFLD